MLKSNNALFFDGVSDGVIIPQGVFSKLGRDNSADERSASDIISESSQGARVNSVISDALGQEIAIEAWVTPDCGGVILQKSSQFCLKIGNIDTPGPASFEVNLQTDIGFRKVIISTATEISNGYDGTVYPSITNNGFEDSFNRFVGSKDDATNLNINHRPLIHVVASVNKGRVTLHINGELMAEEVVGRCLLSESDDHVYIGGRGGEFRGVIEGVHISSAYSNEMITRNAALANQSTLALFRFEEPIEPIEGLFDISSISSASNLSAITISTSDAALLASKLTGKSVTSGTIDFTQSPYSSGNYSVVDYKTTPGTKNIRAIPHVPFNLLINPGSINRDTQKPNQSPPERVRLHNINVSTGAMLVSSIHLDFDGSTNGDGLRPVLHSRSSATGDDYFVVISADLLLDNGSGKPYQPPHLASQLIDRTGQMVLDEGELEQHGIMFSSRMSTTANDSNNPFAVTWPTTLDESFQIGHSGRHTLNHVQGHHYLRNMPRANEEVLDQQFGNADIVELYFDGSAKGIEKQFPINSKVDYYRDIAQSRIVSTISSSTVSDSVDNGLADPSRKLIAIGGAGFNPMPFVLKGPAPKSIDDVDDNIRKHHLRPSKTSRVAILEVDLSSYNLASYIEIHYNAIDFTGVSMGKTAPMLMVEKTVPASNHLLTGSTYVIDAIEASLASGKTLHSPGGIVEISTPVEGNLAEASFTHSLIGDNSEGFESDSELDERYTPQNYTTMTTEPRRPPQNIAASHTTKDNHESVFHHLIIEANNADKFGTSPRASASISSGAAGEFDIGIAASSGPVHEMFDIIDNHAVTTPGIQQRIYVQPSDRNRTAQLRHVKTVTDNANDSHFATIMYLMTRAKLRSVSEEENEDDGGRYTKVRCVGINSAIIDRNVDEIGSGSPDSHVVKEIDPNAPVVTVSLGGVGQGGYDTNPSFDPSTLSRLPYNTRFGFSCHALSVRTDRDTTAADRIQFIEVRALNNNSEDLKSWGTYPFPKKGRLFLKNGASAEYSSKNGIAFFFEDEVATDGLTGRFTLSDGSAIANFYQWVSRTGLSSTAGAVTSGNSVTASIGEIILGDGNFFAENSTADGSTVNDRMFQSMDSVTHDYQLGTQFASTRALVEIPLFSDQFFKDKTNGILPGPDNSLKLHLDPTMTAHTWNPSPVGRRYQEVSPSDRSAHSAYAYALSQNNHTRSASIQGEAIASGGNYKLFVSNPDIFPAADIGSSGKSYFYVDKVQRHQRAFLPNGEWIIYNNDPSTDGFIQFEDATYAHSEKFLETHTAGMQLLVGGGYQSESLVPLVGSFLNPSSSIERRSEYYHDAASVKTQGGNVDYGLRQYVSAVEFKAGPNTNPHAPRIQSGRARAQVTGVEPIMDGTVFTGVAVLIFSEEDIEQFPNIQPNIDTNGNIVYETGDYHYLLEVKSANGDIRRFIYWGDAAATYPHLTGTPTTPDDFRNSIIVEDIFNAGALPNYLDPTHANFILDQEAVLVKRCFSLGFDYDKDDIGLIETLNISDTFRPPTARHPWTIKASPTVTTTALTVTNTTSERLLQADINSLNVQKDDYVYAEIETISGSTIDAVYFLGRVTAIAEGHAQSTPSSDTVLTLDGTMTSAVATLVNSALGNVAKKVYLRVGCHDVAKNDDDAILNRTWMFPYAPGGLRNGDTVWANMTYNNPHAVEGMFAKSRGVLNEALVWSEFNGGEGVLATEARDSIPLENFLIGNTCRETAENYIQHVNKTIELNYNELFQNINNIQPPVVAYLDPTLKGDDHARVLLYDCAHDREFIAFQDLQMQVQSSPKAAEIGYQRHTSGYNLATGGDQIDLVTHNIIYNGASQNAFMTQIDVANGFPSQNKYVRSTMRSRFMESAYAHDIANNYSASSLKTSTTGVVTSLVDFYTSGLNGNGYSNASGLATTTTGSGSGLTVDITTSGSVITAATINAAGSGYAHDDVITVTQSGASDGKFRVRLAPSGISDNLTASNRLTQFGKGHGHFVHTGYHTGGAFSERAVGDSVLPRTQDAVVLPYWANELHKYSRKIRSNLDNFVVKLATHREAKTGASIRDPSTFFDTPDGTRVIPAFLALRGIRSSSLDLSNMRENRLQHLKHWTDMDFTRRLTIDCGEVATRDGITNVEAAAREVVRIINQAGAKNARTNSINGETGSAHDPAVWWDVDKALDTQDSGSHMGYFRAHLGRVVQDVKGNQGHSVIIHSTVPGATGRNFCVWLDNARGQVPYQPEFLIGHGGRFRTFWCQPDEISGENMHPAPMPLNKHGRPFAPITTLRQYSLPDESGTQIKSTNDFAQRGDETSDPVNRAISMVTGSGQSHNTVNVESLEVEGYATNFTEGLRVGTQAVGRINFGGLVAAGVPGFAPDAGTWGFGRKGDDRFTKKYGDIAVTKTGSVLPTSYSAYVPPNQVSNESIGQSPLYGFEFKDHLGNRHGIRIVYRKMDEEFILDETQVPDTLEDEIVIYIDDRDVGQGGFTIGHHMHGLSDATGRFDPNPTHATLVGWRGNRWNGVPSVNAAYDVNSYYLASANVISVSIATAPYNDCPHDDILGYMGFPLENGLVQVSDPFNDASAKGSFGNTFSYTHRSTEASTVGSTKRVFFFGVEGANFSTSQIATAGAFDATTIAGTQLGSEYGSDTDYVRTLISPCLNWTTLVTDEVLAAAVTAAINMRNPNIEEGVSFDCREFFAADGRTLGEWGVADDAIRIRAFNPKRDVEPISNFFSASIHRDMAIQSAHIEHGDIEKVGHDGTLGSSNRSATDAQIDAGLRAECGYIPHTIVQVISKGRGSNGNTPSPVLVDSSNEAVDTGTWSDNLNGARFMAYSGDHILPMVNNPTLEIDEITATDIVLDTAANELWHFVRPAGSEGTSVNNSSGTSFTKIASFGDNSLFSYRRDTAFVTSENGANSQTKLDIIANTKSDDFGTVSSSAAEVVAQRFADHRCFTTAGVRVLGSVYSIPQVFFRGGRDSSDHSVPLFFGGGFSGVTIDINDGTKNDYSDKYTHPYANGPNGVTGIQNANETLSSFSLLDCNAMMAFFPGTALLNQHRGSLNSPFFNRDNVLSPDLKNGSQTINANHPTTAPYARGVHIQVPSPLVLRFAHPTARYSDHITGTENKTTYLIYGPGQAFPYTQEVATPVNTFEPHPGRALTVGNGWSALPSHTGNDDNFMPNHIINDSGNYFPETSAYQLARHRFHWRQTLNWEPPQGKPDLVKLKQRPESGRMYGEVFNLSATFDSGTMDDYRMAHPMRHAVFMGGSMASNSEWCFHMDGGYHPGGSWVDNQLTFNPPHPFQSGNTRVAKSSNDELHPTAFRVAGPLATKVLYGSSGSFAAETLTTSNVNMEYIAVDATRCQNGEELACVLGAAINSFPGGGALKSMGGTFMPSMGNAMRQDRYGWREIDDSKIVSYQNSNNDLHDCFIVLNMGTTESDARNIPETGWLRTSSSFANGIGAETTPAFAPYYARIVFQSGSDYHVKFFIGRNRISGNLRFETAATWDNKQDGVTLTYPTINTANVSKIYVWTKTGIHTVNNSESVRSGYDRVHFSGLVDAIDRTKPVGVVGWAGERYSYLNTLSRGLSNKFAAGLGAWHPSLGFSPYGNSMGCANAFGHIPIIAPMPNSPESSPPNDGSSLLTNFPNQNNPDGPHDEAQMDSAVTGSYTFQNVDTSAFHNTPLLYSESNLLKDLTHKQGIYSRALLVVSHESELALIAKKDRDEQITVGDFLLAGRAGSFVYGGTTKWDDRINGQDRFYAPANAGPNVEALIRDGTTLPTIADYSASNALDGSPFDAAINLHSALTDDLQLENAEPCLSKTGDLFLDIDKSIGSHFSASASAERNISADFYSSASVAPTSLFGGTKQKNTFWLGDVNAYDLYARSPAKNFNIEHIVWKRMDGGSLSMPAVNARGLGAIPFINRVSGAVIGGVGEGVESRATGTAITMGEKIYGNVRFSFETTNSAMLPVLQAQELSHPHLASKHSITLANILDIPNEELQFEDMEVVDDTGQTHILSGGSPLGVIIRAFRPSGERLASGLAPATANSSLSPNLLIQLPDPESIPGNILVRSGFDKLQAYQNETMGDGGMLHPDLGHSHIGHLFDNVVEGPRTAPTMNEVGWEHVSTGIQPLKLEDGWQDKGIVKPDSTKVGWRSVGGDKTLSSSYELHDRTLFFHVTKMGHSHTERYSNTYSHPTDDTNDGILTQSLTVSNYASGTLTASATITASIFSADFATKERSDNRRFLRLATTTDSVVLSYTGISGATFTGVVGDIDFDQFITDNLGTSTINISPSYYIPAGSTRFFAARRLRDHAEVSGNSPDMAHTEYMSGNQNTLIIDRYNKPQLTPMPMPRMGHHFVNATMPMLPGHWAHPAYQGLYDKHEIERRATLQNPDLIKLLDNTDATTTTLGTAITDYLHPLNSQLRVSSLTATPSGPSDIHGGAFTLMFETKVRYDGYGILASKGTAGNMNKAGGHSIVLEAGANYTQDGHFPDPAEVGAYQIVIQPNLRKHQIAGFHLNNSSATGLPDISTPSNNTAVLTGQQVNLVVGIKYDTERGGSPIGGVTLILAEATLADVRGCEIYINEVILDHDPDHGGQFTNIPPMLLYNALGVQGSESPTFTRRTLPYSVGMFVDATPGYTANIPWWSMIHKVGPDDSTSTGFRHLALYRLDNYYEFCRPSHGCVGAQIILAGHPSISPDIYSETFENLSLTPIAKVTAVSSGNHIDVDDASFFPEVPYYNRELIYTDANGVVQTLSYSKRTGHTHSSATMNQPTRFITTETTMPPVGAILRLSLPYSTKTSTELFKDSKSSILTKNLEQLEGGTRDTNALYTPDAFICMWHPNLGRPHTFYSDGSRTWGNATSDRAVNKAAYNSMPEHFETIHYHGVNYAASLGPFNLDFKTPKPPTKISQVTTGSTANTLTFATDIRAEFAVGDYIFTDGMLIGKVASEGFASSTTTITFSENLFITVATGSTVFKDADGSVDTAANIHAMTGYEAQGSNTVMLSHYWPCGSRGGPLVSNLEGYSAWSAGWHIPRSLSAAGGKHWKDADDDGSYAVSSGLAIASSLVSTRSYPFGYRFGLRQPWNRPQWGHYGMRAFTEAATHSGASNFTVGYKAGPLTEYESQTWTTAATSNNSSVTLPTTYVGVMERQTNFSGMIGPDKAEWQVRYSDGRRMTRSFGCPVRIIRNASTAPRDWWGDHAGLGVSTVDGAVGYYLVDWWGNTRGEDVRKAPVRGFGIKPAWDAGDAYEYDRTNNRTPYARLYNNGSPIVNFKGIADSSGDVLSSPSAVIPRFGGRLNNTNSGNSDILVDVFAPTNAMRVGDMGGGRGVRYPTQFNEDILVELSDVYEGSGVVLSHHTAEPTFSQGYMRPRNDTLQSDEVKRGISARLDVAEDGLLKPEAAVSERVESISGASVHVEPISRSSPRIGIDAENRESRSTGISTDMVAVNTEAHSLHSDTGVGQRVVLEGGMQSASQTLADYDLTSLSFNAQPHGGVMRFTHTSNIKAMGGSYILEARSFVNPFDDTGWGRSGSGTTSNPYQTSTSTSNPHNLVDTTVRFMVRPVRLLDNKHIEVFRSDRNVAGSTPQDGNTYYAATSGGKYGLFTYESTNGGATSYMRSSIPNANAPYQPVFLMESSSDTVPVSKGPKLPGAGMTTFDKDTLKTTVTRLIITENTLQHYRSDAPRRTGTGKDYSVKPRFSQSLHSKGHKKDVTYNTSDHSGDA